MSILNFVQVDDDNAVVVVDTRTSAGGEAAKMIALPHLGAVVAGRGRMDVTLSMFMQLAMCATFDEAADRLEGLMQTTLLALPAYDQSVADANGMTVDELHSRQFGNVESKDSHQCLLVGFSEREGGIWATQARVDGPSTSVQMLRSAGCVIGPPHEILNANARSMLATDEGALQFIRTQYALCADGKPGYGGRALVARLSGRTVSMRELGAI